MKRTERLGPQVSLVILSAMFILGSAGGSLTAMLISDPGEITLYMGGFWESAREGVLRASFAGSLLTGLAVPAVIFLFGFSPLGAAVIPLCVAFKGFTFSYTVSAMLRAFGFKGMLLAFGSAGLVNLLYIPCLLLTALFAFRSAVVMASVFFGKHPKPQTVMYGPAYFIQFAMCSVVILGLSSFQTFLQPRLLSWMASFV